MVITSGTAMGETAPGAAALERVFTADHPHPRKASELAAQALLDAGADVRVVRLPQVHNQQRHGLVSGLIQWARAQGVVPVVGDGTQRWSAAHVNDAAAVFALALTHGRAGERYHAVGEEGIAARAVANAVATRLQLATQTFSADEAASTLGWLSTFVGTNLEASSRRTRERLNWQPSGPGLIADIRAMDLAR